MSATVVPMPSRDWPYQVVVDRLAMAVQDVRAAGCDFVIAINDATTVGEALTLKRWLGDLILELSAVQDIAGQRADALIGKD